MSLNLRALLCLPDVIADSRRVSADAVDLARFATHEMLRLRAALSTIADTPGLDATALRALARAAVAINPEPPGPRAAAG